MLIHNDQNIADLRWKHVASLRCFVHFSVIKWSNGDDGHEEPVAVNTDKRIQSIDYQYTLSHDVT